jgi:hypothetical protein
VFLRLLGYFRLAAWHRGRLEVAREVGG